MPNSQHINDNSNDYTNNRKDPRFWRMKSPSDTELPFFAYGIFKPGQLAYSRIEEYVKKAIETEIPYRMRIRDGVPLIGDMGNEKSYTSGYLIYFKEDFQKEAYKIISKTHHKKLYKWSVINVGINKSNVLMGKKPKSGSLIPEFDREEFRGETDPFFREAISLIEENFKRAENEMHWSNINDFLTLQMNYMLLWSAIDRYKTLKYDVGGQGDYNRAFANEETFQKSLKKHVSGKRKIYSAENIRYHTLDPENPEESLLYYYTMRCNVVHRGKMQPHDDWEKLYMSLEELLKIFRDVLDETFR